jgi:hypothetical protein
VSVTDSKSAKILTNVSSFKDVQKSLQEVQKVLDKIEESVNKKTDNPGEEYEGKPGDIRTVLDDKDSYSFEISTKDGWKRPYLSTDIADDVEIVLRNRPALVAKPKEKKLTLGQLDTDISEALLRAPDYDSGWFQATTDSLYVTGATDGVSPNDCYLYASSDVVGIPALGFELTDFPIRWEILITNQNNNSWDDIKNGGINSWVTTISGLDIKFSAHSTWYQPAGAAGFLTSKDHFAISTGNDYVLSQHLAGGNQLKESTVAMNLRIWK